MIKSIGLDLSLCETGVCVLYDDCIHKSFIIRTNFKGVRRLEFIRNEIVKILTTYPSNIVCVEGYSFGSRAGQAFSIGELGGVIKVWLLESGLKTIIIAPTSLKKFITGKGNAPKDVMLMKTLQKYKQEFTNNNQCDAFGLAKVGQAYLNGTDIGYEQEAMKKVEELK
tara:strand:+ start:163 stop:666 length:504 start_codon:yes stop_codon:yes gene_type:complete